MSTRKFMYSLESVRLLIEVPTADAVRCAKAMAGRVAWILTDAMIEGLTPEDRELFASRLSRVEAGDNVVVEMCRASGTPGPIIVKDPDITPASITAAIAVECAAIRERWAAMRAAIEAKPASAWVDLAYGNVAPRYMHDAVEFLRIPGMAETDTARALHEALMSAGADFMLAQRAKYLAADVGDLIDTPYGPHPTARTPPTDDDATRDKLALVEAEVARRIAAAKARKEAAEAQAAEAEAKCKAREAAEKERAALDAAAIRAFAATIPGLERAAAEEYEVATGVLDTLAERVIAVLPANMTANTAREDSPSFRRFKVTASKSPRNARFAQRDALVRAVAQVTKPERGVTMTVGPVESICQRSEREDDAPEDYRGAVVTLNASGNSTRRMVFVRFPNP